MRKASEESVKISGILFDKDGTLLDFAKSWESVNRRCAHYAADGDPELANRLLRACGMDPETGETVADSLFAASSTGEIAAGMIAAGSERTLEDLSHHFDMFFLEGAANAVPLADLQKFFLRLRSRGLKLGIASSDNEASIRRMAEGQHILPLLDYVDMDGALLIAQDIADGVHLVQGVPTFPDTPGLGVTLHRSFSP